MIWSIAEPDAYVSVESFRILGVLGGQADGNVVSVLSSLVTAVVSARHLSG